MKNWRETYKAYYSNTCRGLRLWCIVIILGGVSSAKAQIDPGLVLGLINATTAEMTAIPGPITGSLIYNTTDSAIYQYNGTAWEIVGQTGPQGPPGPQGIQGDPATDDQTLVTNGNPGDISITGGNTITLNVNDGDSNPTNEIQTLSLSGTDLTISGTGGNTVTLTPLIDTNLATDNLTQDAETRNYNMNNQNLGFTNGRVGIGTTTPNSRLSTSGSFSTGIRSTATNTTLGINDFTLIMTEKDLIITLPAASSCQGRIYVLKNIAGDSDTNISYRDKKGEPETKIDKEKTLWLQSDGTNWHLINVL